MEQMQGQPARTRTRGLKWMLVSVAVAVSATVALSAWAARPMHDGAMGGWGGPGMMMGGRGVDHLLDGLNATDAQRAQIKQIMQAAAADLKPQRESSRALHERALQIFTAPTVDAVAAESVRQQMQQQHEQASRRMLQAMLDASQVLTPEQRAKLGERMKQRAEAMRERSQRMDRDQPQR